MLKAYVYKDKKVKDVYKDLKTVVVDHKNGFYRFTRKLCHHELQWDVPFADCDMVALFDDKTINTTVIRKE